VTIGNGVTNIATSAFFTCTSLTSLDIPNNVTNIGSNAFGYCTAMTNVNCYVTRSIMNAPFCLDNTGVITLHARTTDGTWTAGADTIGNKALIVIKDLT
jgi:hypothetical protein